MLHKVQCSVLTYDITDGCIGAARYEWWVERYHDDPILFDLIKKIYIKDLLGKVMWFLFLEYKLNFI